MNFHTIIQKGPTLLERAKYFFQGGLCPSKTQRYSHAGFTLVEALVAITVLLLVVIGPMTAAQKGTQNAYFAREQLTAVFLAQEAVEAVREIRDTKALDVYDDVNTNTISALTVTALWANQLVTNCGGSLGCTYSLTHGFQQTNCAANGSLGCPVYFDSAAKTYTQVSGDPTPFYRTVRVEDVSTTGDGPWIITSKVSWRNTQVFGGATKDVTLQTWVYDQYQRYE